MKLLNKLSRFFIITALIGGFSFYSVNAQDAESEAGFGTLSFSPSSFNINTSDVTNVNIVYSGAETEVAKLVFNLPANVKIENFVAPSGFNFLISDPEQAEVHLGKLDEGPIVSGSTIATVQFRALDCSQGGTISFDTDQTQIPDVSLSFGVGSFSVCSGATSGNNTNGNTGTGGLPKTALEYDQIQPYIMPAAVLSLGLALLILYKSGIISEVFGNKEEKIQIVNK